MTNGAILQILKSDGCFFLIIERKEHYRMIAPPGKFNQTLIFSLKVRKV